MTDKERLDFLDACTMSCNLVTCRESLTGRGWRLHEVSRQALDNFGSIGFGTVRDAIDYFVEHTSLMDVVSDGLTESTELTEQDVAEQTAAGLKEDQQQDDRLFQRLQDDGVCDIRGKSIESEGE